MASNRIAVEFSQILAIIFWIGSVAAFNFFTQTFCGVLLSNIEGPEKYARLGEPGVNGKSDLIVNQIENYSELSNAVSACGGYTEGLEGTVNYKLNEVVADREVCVWTIHVPKKEIVQVRLVQDGFYSNFQNLRIFNTSSSTRYQFRPALELERGYRGTYNITGSSLIQIVFGTFPSENYGATGFSLEFKGLGPDTNSSDWSVPALKVLEPHLVGSFGAINYTENASPSSAEGEFVTFTIQPPRGMEIALTLESYTGPNRGVGCTWNDYYWYDTLRISEIHWDSSSTIRMQQCERTYFKNTILSSYPLVVSHYSFIGGARSFQFSWEFF